jgi:putative transferase (TIGR04331 family)
MHSQKPMPSASKFKDYAREIASIPGKIVPQYRNEFRYRFYHTAYGRKLWGLKNFINENSGLYFDGNLRKSFYDDVNESCLVIISYHPNVTGIETFSANFPTLLYWNRADYPLRAGVDEYYDLFEKVGIYHTSIQSLVDHINKIYPNVLHWWLKDEVQQAVQIYCRQFALTSDKPIDAWAKEIRSKCRNSGVYR